MLCHTTTVKIPMSVYSVNYHYVFLNNHYVFLNYCCIVLSRAGVKGNRKLILVLIQERTLLLVSGRIESSTFSLSLDSCSFLPLLVTRSSGKCTQNTIFVQPLPCVFVCSWALVRICIRANYLSLVRDLPSSNMLAAAISVSSLQARHVRARFECPGTLPSHIAT